ncbi:MAG: outer membrane beta-barrel protein [Bacteroidota bacterium]|nr:outer membrane beta-barrel protein [Bacteroidota bacterium]
MKSTKSLTAIIAFGFIIGMMPFAKAQGPYLTLGAGYAFGANNFLLGTESTTNSNSGGFTSTQTVLNVGLGKGINMGGCLGYMFNKNVGIELGVGYLLGSRIMVDASTDVSSSGSIDKSTTEWQCRSLRIIPAFKVCGGSDKINPYLKFGLIMGMMNSAMEYNNSETTSGSTINRSVREVKYTGTTSFGILGCAGVNYKLNSKIMLFAECNLLAQSFTLAKSVITKDETNGKDNLASMTTNQKETIYSKEVTFDSNATVDKGSPKKGLAFSLPFSSLGINVGIQIAF